MHSFAKKKKLLVSCTIGLTSIFLFCRELQKRRVGSRRCQQFLQMVQKGKQVVVKRFRQIHYVEWQGSKWNPNRVEEASSGSGGRSQCPKVVQCNGIGNDDKQRL